MKTGKQQQNQNILTSICFSHHQSWHGMGAQPDSSTFSAGWFKPKSILIPGCCHHSCKPVVTTAWRERYISLTVMTPKYCTKSTALWDGWYHGSHVRDKQTITALMPALKSIKESQRQGCQLFLSNFEGTYSFVCKHVKVLWTDNRKHLFLFSHFYLPRP